MPFGKHQGREIAELPITYLLWLANLKIRNPPLRRAIDEAFQRRIPREVRANLDAAAEELEYG